MSYKLYLGGLEMEIKDINRLAQTKQVNNVVNLHTRQTNATNNFALPRTAKNVKNLEVLGVIGSKSLKPYEKLSADLLDTITGDWLIYKGWAIITETSSDFKVSLYDGVIDFYKAIDNKKLSEIDLSGLNHLKSLAVIQNSWANNLPYMYIIADYNGKNYSGIDVNADFQVPSARMSYIWERLHQYAGFTYSGATFSTEDFTNLFMTYPKPITDASIQVIPITAQVATMVYNQTPSGMFSAVRFLPYTVSPNSYMSKNANDQLVALTSGSFRVQMSGVTTNNTTGTTIPEVTYVVYDSAGTIYQTDVLDGSAYEVVFIPMNAGDKLMFYNLAYGGPGNWLTTNQAVVVDYVDGYVANFDEALIDFTASEFYKEILNIFGLIPFKDKFSNHITYKTVKQVMQNEAVTDWSSKNPVKLTEKYIVGSYGQLNSFQYKYNQQGASYNNGTIMIANKNLKETNVAIASKFYTPEAKPSAIENVGVYNFPIWEKQIKDDLTIEYKDLSGRYYLHRAEFNMKTFTLKSELLNTSILASGQIPFSSYVGLKWSEIVLKNYEDLTKILNSSKMIEANLFLSSKDVNDFDFQRLVYIEQFSSYFIVNKISNFIKDKYTKVELIEVDYFIEGEQEEVAPYTYITITDVVVNGCTMTITIDTDASYPVNLVLDVFQAYQPVIGTAVQTTDTFTVTANSNVLTFTYTGFVMAGAQMTSIKLWLGTNNIFFGIGSNDYPISLSGCTTVTNGTYVIYNSISTVEIIPEFIGSSKIVQVFFQTDVPLPVNIRFWYMDVYGYAQYTDVVATTNNFQVQMPHTSLFGSLYFTTWLQIGGLVSNQLGI